MSRAYYTSPLVQGGRERGRKSKKRDQEFRGSPSNCYVPSVASSFAISIPVQPRIYLSLLPLSRGGENVSSRRYCLVKRNEIEKWKSRRRGLRGRTLQGKLVFEEEFREAIITRRTKTTGRIYGWKRLVRDYRGDELSPGGIVYFSKNRRRYYAGVRRRLIGVTARWLGKKGGRKGKKGGMERRASGGGTYVW